MSDHILSTGVYAGEFIDDVSYFDRAYVETLLGDYNSFGDTEEQIEVMEWFFDIDNIDHPSLGIDSLFYIFTAGKYLGERVSYIWFNDRGYIEDTIYRRSGGGGYLERIDIIRWLRWVKMESVM